MLESSGGNALVAAVAMCVEVDVYGYGLLSSDGGPAGDKLYTHYFDSHVGGCMPRERLRGTEHLQYGAHLHYFATRVMAHCAANRSAGVTTGLDGGSAAANGSTAAYWSRSRYCRVFRAWRKDRVRAELLLHVLHALGIISWRQ